MFVFFFSRIFSHLKEAKEKGELDLPEVIIAPTS